jgi:mitogen-activated protein kinase kinase kinase 13
MEATPRAKQLSKSNDSGSVLRKTPARKAKAKVGSLAEDSDISTDEELVRMNEEDADRSSSPSVPALTFARKTPLKNRLRPRPGMQTLTPPSDGDDEDDDEAKGVDEPDGIEEEEETSFDVHDLNPVGVAITPRRLRNGKIVGEELLSDEEDEDEVEAGIAEEDEEEVGAEIEEEDEAQAEESASDGDVTVTADVDDVMVDDDEAEPAEVDDDEELTEGDDELVDGLFDFVQITLMC